LLTADSREGSDQQDGSPSRRRVETRVVGLLADGTPRTIADLAAALGEPAYAIRAALKRLRTQGRVVSAGRLVEQRYAFGSSVQHWAALWAAAPGA
jgi:predicted ArsR family transcriptional regulator